MLDRRCEFCCGSGHRPVLSWHRPESLERRIIQIPCPICKGVGFLYNEEEKVERTYVDLYTPKELGK